uniref:Myeloid differentiation primary response protein MyD88-like n=1 Tax=Crassostrea virginica TaxID=6565 RepID=A0A8B8C0V5_CRAVI|nr:myeloid differentiation primary response protein MyD88-like [Crassostrea virginica]
MDNKIKQYDAYVIAGDSEEDQDFLHMMTESLESSSHNLRLYIRSRDGSGEFDFQKEAEIIMNGSEKTIVVLSRDFPQNEICMYLLKVAIAKSPGFRLRIIIPILRERCTLPSCIRFLTANDYTKEDVRPWFWPRVAACFKNRQTMFSEDIQRKKLPEIVCLPDIILHSFTPDKHEHGRRNN